MPLDRRRLGGIDDRDAVDREQPAFAAPRPLLVERGPGPLAQGGAAGGERLRVLPFRPERRARGAAQRVGRLRQRRQAQHRPAGGSAVGLRKVEQAAGEVVRMPAGHDQHDPAGGFQPRRQVGAEPVPEPVAVDAAVRLRLRLDRVVDQHEVGAPSDDRPGDAGREILAARGGREAAGGAVALFQRIAEPGAVLGDEPAQRAAEMLGERQRVAGGDHRTVRAAGEPPGREEDRRVGRFRRARRHLHHQPPCGAARDPLQLRHQQAMMRGGDLAGRREREFGPGGERSADAPTKIPLPPRRFLPALRFRPALRHRRGAG